MFKMQMHNQVQYRFCSFHRVGDLKASEMTMSDEDRIHLMLLVKEGKITADDAVETVRN